MAWIAAGQAMADYKPVSDNLPTLTIAFAGGGWDGKKVPKGQECKKDGGKGATPPLIVSGIPEGANAIIIEINDESYCDLSFDGGHGKIGFWIKGAGEATLPPVPGGRRKCLPAPSSKSRTGPAANRQRRGIYRRVREVLETPYSAIVKAVFKAKEKGQESKLLAIGRFRLGNY